VFYINALFCLVFATSLTNLLCIFCLFLKVYALLLHGICLKSYKNFSCIAELQTTNEIVYKNKAKSCNSVANYPRCVMADAALLQKFVNILFL